MLSRLVDSRNGLRSTRPEVRVPEKKKKKKKKNGPQCVHEWFAKLSCFLVSGVLLGFC